MSLANTFKWRFRYQGPSIIDGILRDTNSQDAWLLTRNTKWHTPFITHLSHAHVAAATQAIALGTHLCSDCGLRRKKPFYKPFLKASWRASWELPEGFLKDSWAERSPEHISEHNIYMIYMYPPNHSDVAQARVNTVAKASVRFCASKSHGCRTHRSLPQSLVSTRLSACAMDSGHYRWCWIAWEMACTAGFLGVL